MYIYSMLNDITHRLYVCIDTHVYGGWDWMAMMFLAARQRNPKERS